MGRDSGGDSGDLLRFLSSPSTYRDGSTRVDVVETHFAWVFLTKSLAYKLNKPIRFHQIDFATLEKRRINCERAIRLNKRLAEAVYLDAVPLVRGHRDFELEGEGEPIEWLIKMHRLPTSSMLDSRLAQGAIQRHDLIPAIAKLCGFYARSPSVHWDGDHYASVLRSTILRWDEQLSAFPAEISIEQADRLITAQLGFVERNRELLDERIARGRVVDAHGDLRPEHISLSDDPQIIDCLEFSDQLRLLDSAEEIAGLALECTRVRHPEIGRDIAELYRLEADDPISEELLRFYESHQALKRAVLCAWHLEDPLYARSEKKWIERTHWYLRVGRACLDSERLVYA